MEFILKIFTQSKLSQNSPKEQQGQIHFILPNLSQETNCSVILFDKKCPVFIINAKTYSLKINAKLQPKITFNQKKELSIELIVLHCDEVRVQLHSKDKSLLMRVYKKLKTIHSHKGFEDYFKPLKRLGKGSFAVVYLIENKLTGQKYAAKVFSRQSQKIGYKGRQCLQNEIKMIQTLDNPHIIRYEGLYETDNLIYVVTEYLSGGTLIQFLRSNRNCLALHLTKIITDILQALVYLKSQNIMHRDIKPQNIVLRKEENTWVLVDFGLAAKTDQDYLYNFCGTMGYIAPEIATEQSKKQKYNQACDMYSFGVVCYQLIVGCLPYNVEVENYYDKKFVWYGLTKDECRQLDPQLVKFLKGLLQTDPKKRWTAQECVKSNVLTNEQIVENWKQYTQKMKKLQYENAFKPRNI